MSKLDAATFLTGDAREKLQDLPEESVQTAITSPPYFGLRDYHAEGQIGLEDSLNAYIENIADVLDEVRRVLRADGTLWLNLGDSYAGSGGPGGDFRDGKGGDTYKRQYDRNPDGLKKKDLCMVPARVAMELQSRGWWLRSEIIWAKSISFNQEYSGSCMPESASDRPTNGHEKIYLLSKSKDYYYDEEAVAEPTEYPTGTREDVQSGGFDSKYEDEESAREGDEAFRAIQDTKKLRDVWTFNPASFSEEHFATFPLELVEPCVKAGSDEGDTVLDPFSGAATTGIAALKHGRKYTGIDVNEDYNELAKDRIRNRKDVPTNHSFW